MKILKFGKFHQAFETTELKEKPNLWWWEAAKLNCIFWGLNLAKFPLVEVAVYRYTVKVMAPNSPDFNNRFQ
jgi:hypothetical protein